MSISPTKYELVKGSEIKIEAADALPKLKDELAQAQATKVQTAD